MIIKQTINNLAHKYRIDLQASLTCLYNTPEINELTPEQMQDILFILERIKCGRAAVYPEFLKGYKTLCFKINMNRVPLRIFIYKRISDGIQIIVDKFSVHKRKHTAADHQARCLKKHATIARLEPPENNTINTTELVQPDSPYNFTLSDTITWSELIDGLQHVWLQINNQHSQKDRKELTNFLDNAIENLFEQFKNVGPHMAISWFEWTNDALTLHYADQSSVALPYLFIQDEVEDFISWLYINVSKQCKTTQHLLLAEIMYQQLKPHLQQKYIQIHTTATNILSNHILTKQYGKTFEHILAQHSPAPSGYEITGTTLPFWLNVSPSYLLKQMNEKKFPATLEQAKTARTLLISLKFQHKIIVLYFINNSFKYLKKKSIINHIPLHLERYTVRALVKQNNSGWENLFSNNHPWTIRHLNILAPPASPKKQSNDESTGSNLNRQTPEESRSPKQLSKRGAKKRNGKKQQQKRKKTHTDEQLTLLDIIKSYRGDDESWISVNCRAPAPNNAQRLETLHTHLTSTQPELIYYLAQASDQLKIAPTKVTLNQLILCYQQSRIPDHIKKMLSQIETFETNKKIHSKNELEQRIKALLTHEVITQLDINAVASEQEAKALFTIIQGDSHPYYRSDRHDIQLLWQKLILFNHINDSNKPQMTTRLIQRLIFLYHSKTLSNRTTEHLLTHIKIALSYALKYYYIGAFSTTTIKTLQNLDKDTQDTFTDHVQYIHNISEIIIRLIRERIGFNSNNSYIVDKRAGKNVTMFTFILRILDEEKYEINDDVTLQKVINMFNQLILMGAEPGVCIETVYRGSSLNTKNELFDVLLLSSYDLFDYFYQLGVPIEDNLFSSTTTDELELSTSFVTGQDSPALSTLVSFVRYKILLLKFDIITCFFGSDLSVWKKNSQLCKKIIDYAASQDSLNTQLHLFENKPIERVLVSRICDKIRNYNAICSLIESSTRPTVCDYTNYTFFTNDNFESLSLLPKLEFINEIDSLDNVVTPCIWFIKLNYLGKNKSLPTPLMTLIESYATKHFEFIANFMRYTSLDFSNIYVPLGYSDESVPLISMMVVTNNVELFTILYEKGVNLSRRSSLGKLPIDYVTETTDPRITLALIHQYSSPKKLARYKKRHSEISSFLENARSICESTPSLQKLTDLLSHSCFEPDTYRRHIMFYFNELISRNVVTQNTVAILIKWWINCVCFCIQRDEVVPNIAIGEMKTVSKRYLSHPSPSKLSPQLVHKHFIFSLWRHQTRSALRTSKWGRLHKRQKTLTQLDSPRSLNKSNNNTNNVLTL